MSDKTKWCSVCCSDAHSTAECHHNNPGSFAATTGSLASVGEARNLVAAKMKAGRPTLREYLRTAREGAGRSCAEWSKVYPGCDQEFYRRGMEYAYREIELMLESGSFKPENNDYTTPVA